VDCGRASERLAVRLQSICDRLVPGKRRRPSRRQIGERQLRGQGGALFEVKEGRNQGSYRGERVGLCAARQELPIYAGKTCRAGNEFSVLSKDKIEDKLDRADCIDKLGWAT
jgi:hypothetical protein